MTKGGVRGGDDRVGGAKGKKEKGDGRKCHGREEERTREYKQVRIQKQVSKNLPIIRKFENKYKKELKNKNQTP